MTTAHPTTESESLPRLTSRAEFEAFRALGYHQASQVADHLP